MLVSMSDKSAVIESALRDGAVEIGKTTALDAMLSEASTERMDRHVAATFDSWRMWRRRLVDEKGRYLTPVKVEKVEAGDFRIPFQVQKGTR